jgi:glycosyltransferase involved in cell wall biosynthesis
MIKVLGLSLYGPKAASPRYRLMQYASGLRDNGVDLEVKGLLGDEYILKTFAGENYPPWNLLGACLERVRILVRQHNYDVVIVHVELFPFLPGLIESRLIRVPYIYDFDDAFFLKYKSERFKRVSMLLQDKFDPIVSRASAVTAGNKYLVDYARRWNPETVYLPTVVDTDRYTPAPSRCDRIFTVGWIGSPSTAVYLSDLVRPLAELAKEGPVRFVVIGARCPPIELVDIVHLPWDEETEVSLINTFDVGVMPLFDDDWCRGKCALKLIQYMACGVPVVGSAVGANLQVVTDDCGFLASDAEAWCEYLGRLRDNVSLRSSMGAAGRKRVESLYSLGKALPIMLKTIKKVAGSHNIFGKE